MKVLFVSGYSEQVVSRHKIADIQAAFLQKPFTVEDAGCQGPGSARQAGIGSQCGPLIRAS